MNRSEFIRRHLDLDGLSVLEIGALDKPVVSRPDASVFYMDHLSTDGVQKKYALDPTVDKSKLVTVDYVWNGGRFADAVVDRKRFDLIVASHVFEHFANPVGWLLDALNVLAEDGCIFLMLPDARFTFDLDRAQTTLSDWIGWHIESLERPSPRQIFDHMANARVVSSVRVWDDPAYRGEGHYHQTAVALHHAAASVADQRYVDSHCSVFTPYRFVELCRGLRDLGLFPYRFQAFKPTEFHDMEFFALLRRDGDAVRPGIDNTDLQAIAREAGYGGAFGGGCFNLALASDPALKRRYDALVDEADQARRDLLTRLTGFPDLDKALHHGRPRADDPRRPADR